MLLNKLIYSQFIIAILTLLVSGCSITESTFKEIKQENDGGNKVFTDAISAMRSGNTKKAQSLLIKVIEQHPYLSNAYVNLGIIQINNKQHNKAETSFQKALKVNPKNIYALNQLGFIYRKKGEFYKAKESYEKAIDINNGYAYAHLNLGILYDLYLYDLEHALKQYKIYNKLTKDKNSQVKKWIFDLERRLKK